MKFLYIIKCNEFHKIGIATDIQERFLALQTGNPYKLQLVDCFQIPNARKVEQHLHRKYANLRELGEWFRLGDDSVRNIQAECVALGGVRIDWYPRRPTESEYLHATIMKVALGFFTKLGLVKVETRSDKIVIDFDMKDWTEGLEPR
jgi:hypothetical protein